MTQKVRDEISSNKSNGSQNKKSILQHRKYNLMHMLLDLSSQYHLPPKYCSYSDFEENFQICLGHLIELSREMVNEVNTSSIGEDIAQQKLSLITENSSPETLTISMPSKNFGTKVIHDCLLYSIRWKTIIEQIEQDHIQNKIQPFKRFKCNNSQCYDTEPTITTSKSVTALDIILRLILNMAKKYFFAAQSIALVLFQIPSLTGLETNNPMNASENAIRKALLEIISTSSHSMIPPETFTSLILENYKNNNKHNDESDSYNNYSHCRSLIRHAFWLTLYLLRQSDYLQHQHIPKPVKTYQETNTIQDTKRFGTLLGTTIVQTLLSITALINKDYLHNKNQDISIIEDMMEILQHLTIHCPKESQSGPAFQFILQASRENPNCVLIRVAAIIACTHIRGYDLGLKCNSIHIFLRKLWADYIEFFNTLGEENKRIDILRIYVEIIVECEIFGCVQDCWMAVRPLIEHAVKKRIRKDDVILRGIGCILVHRGESVLSLDMEQYQGMVQLLKQNFGSEKYDFMWGFHKQVVGAKSFEKFLLRIGILYEDEQFDDSKGMLDTSDTDRGIENDMWPFALPHSLRMLCMKKQLTELSLFKGILSIRNLQNVEQTYLDTPLKKRRREEKFDRMLRKRLLPKFAEKIIREEIKSRKPRVKGICKITLARNMLLRTFATRAKAIGHIFSFLNYKRLCRAMQVCKLWNAVGKDRQDIWKTLYYNRWSNAKYPQNLREDQKIQFNKKWNVWFRQKILVEREKREYIARVGIVNSWITRPCDYVGCAKILVNERYATKHLKYHAIPKAKDETNSFYEEGK